MSEYTVGVEEEYQLVDPKTGSLVSRARDVLETEWAGEARPEAQETMLEIGTRPCGSAADLDDELRRLRFHVASAAAAHDLVPVAAGLHPFSRWEDQAMSSAPHYERLLERYGRVVRSEHTFGMHIHVGVPDATDRMSALRVVRLYLPHLIALSASSPLFEGGDTGYASYRTILTDRYPCSGAPPAFRSEDEYWALVGKLVAAGVIESEGSVYWSVRPHHRYGTIEIRCPDVCPRVEEAVAVGTLVRVLVVAAAEGRLGDPGGANGAGDSVTDALIRSNEWQAARYGLHATLVDGGGDPKPVREEVLRLTERLLPVAEDLGDADMLARVPALLDRGNPARRIREAAGRAEGLSDVVRWLAGETLLGTGMDRRRDQRDQVL